MKHRIDQVARALAEGTSRRQTARRLLGLFLPPPPPPLDFDALARDLARGLSRRQALRRLGGGLAGSLLVVLHLDQAWAQSPHPITCPAGEEFCSPPDRCCPPHWHCCSPHCLPPDWTCCPGPSGNQFCAPGQRCVNGSCVTGCPANTSACTGSRGSSCCNIYHQSCCQGQCCDGPQATCCNDGCHPPNSHCCPEGGACPNGQECCQGACCPQGQHCVSGTCSSNSGCPVGQTLCGTSCVDTRTDPQHCGNCTTVCTGNRICSGGECICPPAQFCADQRPGMTGGLCCAPSEQCHHNQGAPLCLAAGCASGTVPCQGRCVPACSGGKVLDATSCQCVCPGGLMDCGGVCVNTQTDAQHCGSCTNACGSGQNCVGGRCACSSDTQCPAGQHCSNGACCALLIRGCLGPSGPVCCGGATSPCCGSRGSVCCALGPCCDGACCGPGQSCRTNPFTGAHFCA